MSSLVMDFLLFVVLVTLLIGVAAQADITIKRYVAKRNTKKGKRHA